MESVLERCRVKLHGVIADSQYSDSKLGCAAVKAVIPYPANHVRVVAGLLRVDRKFRAYGSEEQKREYH